MTSHDKSMNQQTSEQELDTRDLETKLRQDLGMTEWQIRDLLPIIATHYKAREAEIRIDELDKAIANSNAGSHGVSKLYIRRRRNQWRSIKTSQTLINRL